MPREIKAKIDALFVEGPDDGAVVNALVNKLLKIDLAKLRLVKTKEEGGGHAWAIPAFETYISENGRHARVGLIVDRDRAQNDNWPSIRALLGRLGREIESPAATGTIVDGSYGIWMWPDNTSFGDLESFVGGIVPQSSALSYAGEVCRTAKELHGAEYEPHHERKAALKVRSVWRDASAAGGYGHLLRNLRLTDTPASLAFLAWFTELFLT